jgi:glycosyltransferase involved in cell wall biosynthesis
MAAGKPVIGSYVGGIKDTIVHGETGFHIAAGDIEKLTFLLLKLLNDKSLNEKLGKNALIRVQKQSDSRMIAKRIERLYFDVMS